MAKKKVGRPLNIETPEKMAELFEEYKQDLKIKELEWVKVQYVGKDGERVEDAFKLPYTLEGLKRFAWQKGIGEIEQYFGNQAGLYDKFIGICSHIRNEIRENQIAGGMVGVFNASITQRLNGLADKKELDVKAEPRVFNID